MITICAVNTQFMGHVPVRTIICPCRSQFKFFRQLKNLLVFWYTQCSSNEESLSSYSRYSSNKLSLSWYTQHCSHEESLSCYNQYSSDEEYLFLCDSGILSGVLLVDTVPPNAVDFTVIGVLHIF
jgi:hypothetical protein